MQNTLVVGGVGLKVPIIILLYVDKKNNKRDREKRVKMFHIRIKPPKKPKNVLGFNSGHLLGSLKHCNARRFKNIYTNNII